MDTIFSSSPRDLARRFWNSQTPGCDPESSSPGPLRLQASYMAATCMLLPVPSLRTSRRLYAAVSSSPSFRNVSAIYSVHCRNHWWKRHNRKKKMIVDCSRHSWQESQRYSVKAVDVVSRSVSLLFKPRILLMEKLVIIDCKDTGTKDAIWIRGHWLKGSKHKGCHSHEHEPSRTMVGPKKKKCYSFKYIVFHCRGS